MIIKVIGPLSKAQKVIKCVENDASGEMTLSSKEVATNLDKFVMLLHDAV